VAASAVTQVLGGVLGERGVLEVKDYRGEGSPDIHQRWSVELNRIEGLEE
jgi:hypothetical protein